MKTKSLLLCLLYFLCGVDSAKILGIFPAVTYSHHSLGLRLMKELSALGHEVTFLNPYEQKPRMKNFRDIVLTGFVEEAERIRRNLDLYEVGSTSSIFGALFVGHMGLFFTDTTLSHENVQKLLKSNETFDLVLMEQFLDDAFHGFAHHFKAPSILLSTIGSSMWTNPLVGNPAPPSYVVDLYLDYTARMTFLQRINNALFTLFHTLYMNLYFLPAQNRLLQKYFPGAPHLSDLIHNTSLILLNSHVSFDTPVPRVPNMIDIGGFHVQLQKKLPDDLQIFLDAASDGVVYFSLGSNLRSSELDSEKREGILKAFSKLKMKVLWKWEDDNLPAQPVNVKIGKWLPQQDILRHPNVKLFITHGGLLSTIEAVYFGVPIIGIPIYGDQKMNMANAVNHGYGVVIPYRELSEETLDAALNMVLKNSSFLENAKKRSRLLHDQPMKPLAMAVYWIEHVLRHNGAPHLQNAGLSLSWYQYSLLDIILFLTLVTIVLFLIFYIIIKHLLGRRRKLKQKMY